MQIFQVVDQKTQLWVVIEEEIDIQKLEKLVGKKI